MSNVAKKASRTYMYDQIDGQLAPPFFFGRKLAPPYHWYKILKLVFWKVPSYDIIAPLSRVMDHSLFFISLSFSSVFYFEYFLVYNLQSTFSHNHMINSPSFKSQNGTPKVPEEWIMLYFVNAPIRSISVRCPTRPSQDFVPQQTAKTQRKKQTSSSE